MTTQNDGLKKLIPLKYGKFWHLYFENSGIFSTPQKKCAVGKMAQIISPRFEVRIPKIFETTT